MQYKFIGFYVRIVLIWQFCMIWSDRVFAHFLNFWRGFLFFYKDSSDLAVTKIAKFKKNDSKHLQKLCPKMLLKTIQTHSCIPKKPNHANLRQRAANQGHHEPTNF